MVSPSHIITFYEVRVRSHHSRSLNRDVLYIYALCWSFQAFNGKKWEKFNSEKVASLAYARIQGKIALVSHFQNSSLMNEDKRCRPIVFQSEGQGTSDLVCHTHYNVNYYNYYCSSDYLTLSRVWDAQEPFPSGNLNIFIRQPDGSYLGDSLDSPKGDPDIFWGWIRVVKSPNSQ